MKPMSRAWSGPTWPGTPLAASEKKRKKKTCRENTACPQMTEANVRTTSVDLQMYTFAPGDRYACSSTVKDFVQGRKPHFHGKPKAASGKLFDANRLLKRPDCKTLSCCSLHICQVDYIIFVLGRYLKKTP